MKKRIILTPGGRFSLTVLLGIAVPGVHHAQDSLESVENFDTFTRRQAAFREAEPFRLHLGNVNFNARMRAGLLYDDNIYVSDDEKVEDLLLTVGIGFDANWQISERNSLNVTISSLDYGKSFVDSERDRLKIGGSAISYSHQWDFFSFNVYDRFSFSEDPADNDNASNLDSFGGFENTFGLGTVWNYDLVDWRLGYSHYNFISFDSSSDILERSRDAVNAGASFNINSYLQAGPDFSVSTTDYDQPDRSDSVNYSAGVYGSLLLSEKVSVYARTGYSYYDLDTSTTSPATTDGSWYVSASVSHRYNSRISQSLSASYGTQLGTYADLSTSLDGSYDFNIRYNSRISAGFFVTGSTTEVIIGGRNDPYINYSVGSDIDIRLLDHLSLNVRYEFRARHSDDGADNYTRNRVWITTSYSF